MNPQKVFEWLAQSGFIKTTGAVAVGSSASLFIAFQQIEHRVDLIQLETNKRIEVIEQKMRSDELIYRQYVDSKFEVIKVQYTNIHDSMRDVKDELSEIRRRRR